MIMKRTPKMEEIAVRGITNKKSEAKITLCAVPDRPGIAATIFNEISKLGVSVDTIVQNVSHTRHTDISFTVPKRDLNKTLNMARRIAKDINAGKVNWDENIARVSIIGSGMRSHSGIAAKMFQTLAEANVNIDMITTSEISISCIIEQKFTEKAIKALHKAFGLEKI